MSSTSSVTQTDYTEILVGIYVADLTYSNNPLLEQVQMSSARLALKIKGGESLPYVARALREAFLGPEPNIRVREGLAILMQQIGQKIRYPVPEEVPLRSSASWIAWAEEAQANV